jgi:hypothetical protein
MPDHIPDLQHDMGLLKRAIEIVSEATVSGLLSAAECQSLREELMCLEEDTANMSRRLVLIRA